MNPVGKVYSDFAAVNHSKRALSHQAQYTFPFFHFSLTFHASGSDELPQVNKDFNSLAYLDITPCDSTKDADEACREIGVAVLHGQLSQSCQLSKLSSMVKVSHLTIMACESLGTVFV
jgi:hypothetical protein